MTTKRPIPARAFATALALAATAALGACGQRPAPSPSFEPTPADARPSELAGAPETSPAPAPPEPAAPPPPPAATTVAPPPVDAPPPPAARGGDEVIYDLGPVTPATAPPRAEDRPGRPRVRRSYEIARAEPQAVAPPVHRHAPAAHAATSTRPAPAVAAAPHATTATRPAHAPAVAAHHAAPASHKVAAPPPAQKAKPIAVASEKTGKAGKGAAKASKSAKPKSTASGADRGAKLQSLQAALRDAVSRKAELSAPERPPAGQPADVTLTLPADFAQTVREAATKADLADAAATVNLTAQLSGDGYAVTPGETQAQPLTVGQPTEFHWTVTAQPNARGPLRADVGADLLGAGSESLSLGAVSPKGGGLRLSSRVLGAGLLVLIAVVVLAWLARGNRDTAKRDAARRAAARRSGAVSDRPLDMTRSPFDPPRPGASPTPRDLDDTAMNNERRDPPEAPR